MNSYPDQRISPDHLSRSAVVYVRQSSPGQVRENTESTRIQLNLCEKAVALGWRSPRVIQDDLGISASGYVERPGFQELLTRVAMREIGIILCMDASRLSRNSKDWAHLFEFCSYFKTLIADLEQIYDLSHPNDRLLMGIKGTVSEMELTAIRTRLRSGMESKAKRGELKISLPIAYVYDTCDQIVFNPDQRIQRAVHRMFEQFDRCTSVRQLAMWYRDNQELFPVKHIGKDMKIRWEIPASKTLYNHLRHPIFAGAYVWGRRFTYIDYRDGKLIKRVGERNQIEDYKVCIRDHHPAYIPWEKFMANQTRITENKPRWNMEQHHGAIRDGLALLTGLLRCRHCGGKIHVSYKVSSALYYCDGGHEKGSKRCLSFGSKLIDRAVSTQLLKALEPLSVEAAVAASEMKGEQLSREMESARMQVESAQYEADRTLEQFDQCDPKNRLVADTLEERLNDKLWVLKGAKEKLEELSQRKNPLTKEQRRRLKQLAQDFEKAWNHPEADPRLKKRILRSAIHEILVQHDPEHQRLEVTLHWKGGVHSQIHVKKNATPIGRKATPSLVQLVQELAAELSDAEITRILNMKKLETPRGLRWTKERVQSFRRHHRIPACKLSKSNDYLTMNEVMAYLGISHNGVLGLVRRGVISSNQITDFAPWRVSRKELDSEHVQRFVRVLKETKRLPKGGWPKNHKRLFDEK